jgi:hypothetical protein
VLKLLVGVLLIPFQRVSVLSRCFSFETAAGASNNSDARTADILELTQRTTGTDRLVAQFAPDPQFEEKKLHLREVGAVLLRAAGGVLPSSVVELVLAFLDDVGWGVQELQTKCGDTGDPLITRPFWAFGIVATEALHKYSTLVDRVAQTDAREKAIRTSSSKQLTIRPLFSTAHNALSSTPTVTILTTSKLNTSRICV